jgi:hypothetical protein
MQRLENTPFRKKSHGHGDVHKVCFSESGNNQTIFREAWLEYQDGQPNEVM